MQVLWFLCSACRLSLIGIYTKFREDRIEQFSSYRADMIL